MDPRGDVTMLKRKFRLTAWSHGPTLADMLDDTPMYLTLMYEKWFDDHPGARAEIKTTTVRQQTRLTGPKTYVKNTPEGDVEITKDEFDARYWARERGSRLTR
jgi:hypothetical protein